MIAQFEFYKQRVEILEEQNEKLKGSKQTITQILAQVKEVEKKLQDK